MKSTQDNFLSGKPLSDSTTNTFEGIPGIHSKIKSILKKNNFTVPTAIQHQVIPPALEGKDVIGIAQTGTGKTLGFGIPMIQRLAQHKGQGLILVPTRELALQVGEAIQQIGKPLTMRVAVLIGGVPQSRQIKALRANPHLIIATPGRLDDLLKQKQLKLDRVKIIALDEADRMLDIGFLPQIKTILSTVPRQRQTMLFSATLPNSIGSLAKQFMSTPLRIEVAPQGTSAQNIEQEVFIVPKSKKMDLLKSILQESGQDLTLIFSRTKFGAKKIAGDLNRLGYSTTEIHSNRSQAQRKAALEGFAKGKYKIMVATDIAARGIDVKDITLVVNFDLPENSEDYVHRIGRTGRAGRNGKAISFVTETQKYDLQKIEKLIRKALPITEHSYSQSFTSHNPTKSKASNQTQSAGHRYAKKASRSTTLKAKRYKPRNNKRGSSRNPFQRSLSDYSEGSFNRGTRMKS